MVKIGDKQLDKLEKVLNAGKAEPEPCMYGGIELKGELKEILDILPKHTCTKYSLDYILKNLKQKFRNVK